MRDVRVCIGGLSKPGSFAPVHVIFWHKLGQVFTSNEMHVWGCFGLKNSRGMCRATRIFNVCGGSVLNYGQEPHSYTIPRTNPVQVGGMFGDIQ